MFFEKLIIGFFKVFLYRKYRKKYKIPKCFKFNGYFIRITGEGDLLIGENSYVSFFSYFNIEKNTYLKIGSKVQIGHNVKVYTSSVNTNSFILDEIDKSRYGDVVIEDNVLIGSNVFILPGVRIGHNSIVGANSVISEDVPPYSIASCPKSQIIKTLKNE